MPALDLVTPSTAYAFEFGHFNHVFSMFGSFHAPLPISEHSVMMQNASASSIFHILGVFHAKMGGAQL